MDRAREAGDRPFKHSIFCRPLRGLIKYISPARSLGSRPGLSSAAPARLVEFSCEGGRAALPCPTL